MHVSPSRLLRGWGGAGLLPCGAGIPFEAGHAVTRAAGPVLHLAPLHCPAGGRTPALAPQGAAARSRLPATGLAFTGRLESGRPAEGGADLAGRADARLLTTDGGGVAGGRRTTS